MSKKWVISDLHLGHANILKYSDGLRGGIDADTHDQWLIDQINSVVKKGDLLYLVGDVAMNAEALHKIKKIKCGMKILIRGNHDIEDTKKYLDYFQQVHGLISFRGTFWISHAPIHPGSLRNRYNIHGHVHQNSVKLENSDELDPRYINACVEMTYGIPQSLDALFEKHKAEVWQKSNANWQKNKELREKKYKADSNE